MTSQTLVSISPGDPPAYRQIADLLARRIRVGHWAAGERMPTEAQLADELNVAIGTLRKSLALLAEQGDIERIHGSGTYVRAPGEHAKGRSFYGLFRLELLQGAGLPTAQVLSVAQRNCPSTVPLPCSRAWRVRRLRLLDGHAAALEDIWFDARHAQNLSTQDIGDAMYLLYEQRFKIWISRVQDEVSVAAVPSWSVSAFGMKPGEAAGYVQRHSLTATGEIEEFSRTWFNPRVCRYVTRFGA